MFEKINKFCGGASIVPDTAETVWRPGYGSHHRLMPSGLGWELLLEGCRRAGIKYNYRSYFFQSLPTEAGIIHCDFEKILLTTDSDSRPFMLYYSDQKRWVREQGGDIPTSVEETLYILLRFYLEQNRVPFAAFCIRCRNSAQEFRGIPAVEWQAEKGLAVVYTSNHPSCCATVIPRKLFTIPQIIVPSSSP